MHFAQLTKTLSATLTIAALIVVPRAVGDADTSPSCAVPHTTTLLAATLPQTRIYRQTLRGPMILCIVRGGQLARTQLDDTYGGTFYFPPPAMSVRGSTLALSVAQKPADEFSDGRVDTEVAKPTVQDGKVALNTTSDNLNVRGLVSRILLAPDGTTVYTTCPQEDYYSLIYKLPVACRLTTRSPTNRLILVRPNKRRRLLDRGRGLDPSSVRLTSTHVEWTDDGHKRAAPLAP